MAYLFLSAVADQLSVVAGAYTITAFNVAFPVLAKALTNAEPHPSESAVQTSLYFVSQMLDSFPPSAELVVLSFFFKKISIFRWVSTAIVITIITSFNDTLKGDEGLIEKVYQQFFSEIVVSSSLQGIDIMGHVNRHFLAPRAKHQDAMNLLFKGTPWNLAERYVSIYGYVVHLDGTLSQ